MKVGFLDYQLTNSHFKKFHSLLTGPIGGGDITIVAADELSPTDQGRQWCAANNVKYCDTAQEVVAESDALIVLAPNNPEKKLEVATPAVTSGKPVYIDKLLADSPAHAQAILDVAKKMNSPILCASAVRFALELDELDKRLKGKPEAIFARGYGKFNTYAIHTITLALRYFGSDIRKVIDTGTTAARAVTIDNGTSRATIEVRDATNAKDTSPWQIGVLSAGRYEVATITNTDGFYENLMRKTVDFFRTKESPISIEEQMAAVQVFSAAEESFAKGGEWVETKD